MNLPTGNVIGPRDLFQIHSISLICVLLYSKSALHRYAIFSENASSGGAEIDSSLTNQQKMQFFSTRNWESIETSDVSGYPTDVSQKEGDGGIGTRGAGLSHTGIAPSGGRDCPTAGIAPFVMAQFLMGDCPLSRKCAIAQMAHFRARGQSPSAKMRHPSADAFRLHGTVPPPPSPPLSRVWSVTRTSRKSF